MARFPAPLLKDIRVVTEASQSTHVPQFSSKTSPCMWDYKPASEIVRPKSCLSEHHTPHGPQSVAGRRRSTSKEPAETEGGAVGRPCLSLLDPSLPDVSRCPPARHHLPTYPGTHDFADQRISLWHDPSVLRCGHDAHPTAAAA